MFVFDREGFLASVAKNIQKKVTAAAKEMTEAENLEDSMKRVRAKFLHAHS